MKKQERKISETLWNTSQYIQKLRIQLVFFNKLLISSEIQFIILNYSCRKKFLNTLIASISEYRKKKREEQSSIKLVKRSTENMLCK